MPNTHDFAELYELVTDELNVRAAGVYDSESQAWLKAVIHEFIKLYHEWPTVGHPVNEYLDELDKPEVPRLARLAGHLFLHIAFDLPRVISASLGTVADSVRGTNSPSALATCVPISDRNLVRTLYLSLGPDIVNVIQSNQGEALIRSLSPRSIRIADRLTSIFSPESRSSILRLISHWVLALRNAAWVYGEYLTDAKTDADRRDYIDQLASRLLANQSKALKRPWLRGVSNYGLFAAAPILVGVTMLQWSIGLGTIGGLLAGGLLVWRELQRYRETVGLIDLLGDAAYSAMRDRSIERRQ